MTEHTVEPDAENRSRTQATKSAPEGRREEEVDWLAYVQATHSKYVARYVTIAQENTADHTLLAKELPNLMNAAQQATGQQAHEMVLEMVEWLWSSGGQFLDLRGRTQEGLQLLTQALEAARLLEDKRQEGRILGQLGRLHMARRKWSEAAGYFEEALTIAREVGDRQGEASTLGNLGQIHLERASRQRQQEKFAEAQSALTKAEEQFQEAVKIAGEIGDRQMEGRLRASLGLVQLRKQIFVGYSHQAMMEAIKSFKRAISIARETGDRRGEASHLGSLGGAYELMASMNVAQAPFVWGSPYPGDDVARYERYKRQSGEANKKSYLEAYEYYSHALEIAQTIGDEQMEERLHGDRARVAPQADLPVFRGTGDINLNIWMRNQRPEDSRRIPGTRHRYEDTD